MSVKKRKRDADRSPLSISEFSFSSIDLKENDAQGQSLESSPSLLSPKVHKKHKKEKKSNLEQDGNDPTENEVKLIAEVSYNSNTNSQKHNRELQINSTESYDMSSDASVISDSQTESHKKKKKKKKNKQDQDDEVLFKKPSVRVKKHSDSEDTQTHTPSKKKFKGSQFSEDVTIKDTSDFIVPDSQLKYFTPKKKKKNCSTEDLSLGASQDDLFIVHSPNHSSQQIIKEKSPLKDQERNSDSASTLTDTPSKKQRKKKKKDKLGGSQCSEDDSVQDTSNLIILDSKLKKKKKNCSTEYLHLKASEDDLFIVHSPNHSSQQIIKDHERNSDSASTLTDSSSKKQKKKKKKKDKLGGSQCSEDDLVQDTSNLIILDSQFEDSKLKKKKKHLSTEDLHLKASEDDLPISQNHPLQEINLRKSPLKKDNNKNSDSASNQSDSSSKKKKKKKKKEKLDDSDNTGQGHDISDVGIFADFERDLSSVKKKLSFKSNIDKKVTHLSEISPDKINSQASPSKEKQLNGKKTSSPPKYTQHNNLVDAQADSPSKKNKKLNSSQSTAQDNTIFDTSDLENISHSQSGVSKVRTDANKSFGELGQNSILNETKVSHLCSSQSKYIANSPSKKNELTLYKESIDCVEVESQVEDSNSQSESPRKKKNKKQQQQSQELDGSLSSEEIIKTLSPNQKEKKSHKKHSEIPPRNDQDYNNHSGLLTQLERKDGNSFLESSSKKKKKKHNERNVNVDEKQKRKFVSVSMMSENIDEWVTANKLPSSKKKNTSVLVEDGSECVERVESNKVLASSPTAEGLESNAVASDGHSSTKKKNKSKSSEIEEKYIVEPIEDSVTSSKKSKVKQQKIESFLISSPVNLKQKIKLVEEESDISSKGSENNQSKKSKSIMQDNDDNLSSGKKSENKISKSDKKKKQNNEDSSISESRKKSSNCKLISPVYTKDIENPSEQSLSVEQENKKVKTSPTKERHKSNISSPAHIKDINFHLNSVSKMFSPISEKVKTAPVSSVASFFKSLPRSSSTPLASEKNQSNKCDDSTGSKSPEGNVASPSSATNHNKISPAKSSSTSSSFSKISQASSSKNKIDSANGNSRSTTECSFSDKVRDSMSQSSRISQANEQESNETDPDYSAASDTISEYDDEEEDFQRELSKPRKTIEGSKFTQQDLDTFARLEGFYLSHDFEVHKAHTLETKLQGGYPKDVKKRFAELGVKQGSRFTPFEDEIINNNWKKFCELYQFKESEGFMFTKVRRRNKYVMSVPEFLRFYQFLGQGLPLRPLHAIFYRFQFLTITVNCKKGRYTKSEDETIMKYVEEDHDVDTNKITKLAEILNRDRASVYQRYLYLKNAACISRASIRLMVRDPKRVEQQLKLLMKVCKCTTVKQLDRKTIPWAKVNLVNPLKYNAARTLWYRYLYTALHLKKPISRREVELKLVHILKKRTDIRCLSEIDWKGIARDFECFHHIHLSNICNVLRHRSGIQSKNAPWTEILDHMEDMAIKRAAKTNSEYFMPLRTKPDGTIIQPGLTDYNIDMNQQGTDVEDVNNDLDDSQVVDSDLDNKEVVDSDLDNKEVVVSDSGSD